MKLSKDTSLAWKYSRPQGWWRRVRRQCRRRCRRSPWCDYSPRAHLQNPGGNPKGRNAVVAAVDLVGVERVETDVGVGTGESGGELRAAAAAGETDVVGCSGGGGGGGTGVDEEDGHEQIGIVAVAGGVVVAGAGDVEERVVVDVGKDYNDWIGGGGAGGNNNAEQEEGENVVGQWW